MLLRRRCYILGHSGSIAALYSCRSWYRPSLPLHDPMRRHYLRPYVVPRAPPPAAYSSSCIYPRICTMQSENKSVLNSSFCGRGRSYTSATSTSCMCMYMSKLVAVQQPRDLSLDRYPAVQTLRARVPYEAHGETKVHGGRPCRLCMRAAFSRSSVHGGCRII